MVLIAGDMSGGKFFDVILILKIRPFNTQGDLMGNGQDVRNL